MNEIKEVPIDEFGGLESNLSLDNEKYAFAIITTHVTESFSVESPREMTEWTTLLQEYWEKVCKCVCMNALCNNFLSASDNEFL